MKKKYMIFLGICVLTILLFIADAYMVFLKEEYCISLTVWCHIGVAALLGGTAKYISNKCKWLPVVEIGTIVVGFLSYFAQCKWLYFVYLPRTIPTDIEILKTAIRANEVPWLFAMISMLAFLLTYFILLKKARLINPEVTEELTMKQDITPEKVEFEEISLDSDLTKNLMRLRKYEYRDLDEDLSVFSDETILGKIDKDMVKLFTVSYEDKIVGYYIVKEEDDNEYEFSQIFSSPNIDYSFQVLNAALKKHLHSLKGASIKFSNIGLLPTAIGTVIEIIVKDYTNSTYELIGNDEANEKTNYDIRFRA